MVLEREKIGASFAELKIFSGYIEFYRKTEFSWRFSVAYCYSRRKEALVNTVTKQIFTIEKLKLHMYQENAFACSSSKA